MGKTFPKCWQEALRHCPCDRLRLEDVAWNNSGHTLECALTCFAIANETFGVANGKPIPKIRLIRIGDHEQFDYVIPISPDSPITIRLGRIEHKKGYGWRWWRWTPAMFGPVSWRGDGLGLVPTITQALEQLMEGWGTEEPQPDFYQTEPSQAAATANSQANSVA